MAWKTQFERRISPQTLIQPESMAEFSEEMESETSDPQEIFKIIEERILYTNDFFNHASLDHLPTAEEVLSSAQDDCDGQAILLCSVLRYKGYDCYAVVGPSHAWVEVYTETGEVLRINYKGGNWFVRFNESFVEWRVHRLLLLILEEFLVLAVFFAVLVYAYEKRVFTYMQDVLGYFKYVLLFLLGYILIGTFVLIFKSTLWVAGLVGSLIVILLIAKLATKAQRILQRTE